MIVKRSMLVVGPEVPNIANQVRYQRLKMLVERYDVHLIALGPVPESLAKQCQSVVVVASRFKLLLKAVGAAHRLRSARHCAHRAVVYTDYGPRGIAIGWACKLVSGSHWVFDLYDHPSLTWSTDGPLGRLLKKMFWYCFARSVVRAADCWIVGMHAGILAHMPRPAKACAVLYTGGPGWTSLERCDAVDRPTNDGPCEIVAVYAGPLTKERGLHNITYLIQRYNGPRVCLHLFGSEGPGAGVAIDRATAQSNVDAIRVVRHGLVEHARVSATMALADIGLCPLGRETLNYRYAYPVKIVEYISRELIVVATEGEGIRGLLADGATGFVAEATPESFCSKFITAVALAGDSAARATFVREARAQLGDRSWNTLNGALGQKLFETLRGLDDARQ